MHCKGRHGSCIESKLIITTVLVIACLLSAQVYAVSYQIPIRSSGYPSLTVSVQIPRGWAANSIRQAMQIWNQAQIWFAKEYFPNSNVYTFTEAGARYVHVIWVPYSPIYGGRTGGSSCMTNEAEGTIGVNCSVTIVLTYSNGTNLAPALILHGALHEFGHVLGLGHPDSDIIPNDLMNPENGSNAMTPSTLDLYAVHLMAAAVGTTSRLSAGVVTLPAYIPYMNYGINVTTSYTTFSQTYSTSDTISIITQESTAANTIQTTTNLSGPAVLYPTIYILILSIIGVITIGLYMRGRYSSPTTASRSNKIY